MKSIVLLLALGLTICNSRTASPPRMVRVSFEYLEACEVGPECKPVVVNRKKGEKVELVLPRLLRTSVTIWDEKNFKLFSDRTGAYKPLQRVGGGEVSNAHEIILPLSQLQDGVYYVWVVGDSVGGIFQVHLKTT